ncbi:MAG: DUF6531 domain-containing protein [Xanthomonadales bacterium]|nr:DUF6531 domain-containing protein [Xanthomonadales bacterium]
MRVLAVTMLLALGSVGAQDFSVCPAGPPDCSYSTIGEALENAGDDATITIKEPGTYQESQLRRARSGITIRSEDPGARKSFIIDGGGADGPVLFLGSGWTLEGVTITGGNQVNGSGGGIAASGDSTVRNCIIRGNSADSGGGGLFNGSGSGATITIENTAIYNNQARFGAGVAVVANLVMRNSQVYGNTATRVGGLSGFGGGISATGNLTLENSVIRDNRVTGTGGTGGGLRKRVGGNLVQISNTVFQNNSASDDGGGLNLSSPATITGGAITGNTSGDDGGGIDFSSGNTLIINGTAITGNSAADSGGGIFCGGTLAALSGALGNNGPDDLASNCLSCTEGQQQSCSTGRQGMCASGIQTCSANGTWGECRYDGDATGILGLATAEEGAAACSDGEDNDCDGLVDQADPQCDCVGIANKLAGKGLLGSDCDPRTTADTANSGSDGDPVNTFSGELYNSFDPDLDLGGPIPVRFERYYASGLEAAGRSGRLGANWRHGFEWTFADGGNFVEIISPRGRLIRFVDDAGQWRLDGPRDILYQLVSEPGGWVLGDPQSERLYVFGLSLNLDVILDGNGNALSLSYSGSDLTSVSDNLGRMLDFTYSGGRLASVTDGQRTVGFGHDATMTDLVAVTDARGQTTTFAYQAGSLMTAMTRPRGNTPFTQTWDAAGRVITQRDALMNTTGFSYNDPAPGDTTLSDSSSDDRTHRHSDWGGLTQVVDRSGESIDLVNDGDGRRGALVDRRGDVTQLTYDPVSGDVSRHERPDGSRVSTGFFSYRVRGIEFRKPSTVVYPDGRFILREFDAAGNLTQVTDAAGHSWQFTRNSRGQVLTITNPAGGETVQTYNADGTLESRRDPAGNLTRFGYDVLGRMIQVTFADGEFQTIAWDGADQPVSVTDARGNATMFTYDANRNLSMVTNRLGEVTTLAYDDRDRLVELRYDDNARVTLEYDSLNRLAAATDGSGRRTALVYDSRDRPVQIIDPAGDSIMVAYDPEGTVVSVTDSAGNATTLERGLLGRLTGLVNSIGAASSLAYDASGRLTDITSATGRTVERAYDANGRLAATTRAGATIARGFDPLGRLVSLTDPAGNSTTATNDNQGRPLSVTDRLGNTTAYQYDSRGRVAGITLPDSLGTGAYTYDANGNLTAADFSDGTTVTASYDAADRLTSGTGIDLDYDAQGRIVASNGLTIERDGAGRIAAIVWPDGFRADYSYTSGGLLAGIADSFGNTMDYSYDAADRVVRVVRSNGIESNFGYDAAGRLTFWRHGSGSPNKIVSLEIAAELEFDADNRLLNKSGEPVITPDPSSITTTSKTYNAADQVGLKTWDALGRAVSAGDETFAWNARSELESITTSGEAVQFSYDFGGYPVSQLDSGISTLYGWNHGTAQSSLALEMQFLEVTRRHVPTPAGLPAYTVMDQESVRFPLTDEVDNVVAVTDAWGALTYRAAYDPWGGLLAQLGSRDMPFGARGGKGAVNLAGDIVSRQPGHYFHTGAGTRLAPALDNPDFSTNPYTDSPFGNPLDVRTGAETTAAANGISGSLNSLLDGLDTFRENAADAVQAAGRAAFRDTRDVPYLNRISGGSLSSYLFFEEQRRRICDNPFAEARTKLGPLDTKREKEIEEARKREKRRQELQAEIKGLEGRIEGLKEQARRTGQSLSVDPDRARILGGPEIELIDQLVNEAAKAVGIPVFEQKAVMPFRLQQQFDDAERRLEGLKQELDKLDSVLFELKGIVSLC